MEIRDCNIFGQGVDNSNDIFNELKLKNCFEQFDNFQKF